MTPETVIETIQNYETYRNELKNLVESLGDQDEGTFNMMGIGLSSKEERIRNRAETLERQLIFINEAIEQAGLTDREWTTVDRLMDRMNLTSIGKEIFGLSHTTTRRILKSAAEKISYFIINGHVQ